MAVPGYRLRFPARGGSPNVVSMRDKEWTIFDTGIDIRAKARLQATMETYCVEGPSAFPDTLFRFLEHYEGHGLKVRLEEFKATAVRLFGFRGDDEGQPTFFVTGADTAKKRPKADRGLVDLAGRQAIRVLAILRKQAKTAKGKR